MTVRGRNIGRWGGVVASAAVLMFVSVVPMAGADDPIPPVETAPPAESVPSTSAAPTTTIVDPATSSTTTSSTTSVPGTTLPPVDDETIDAESAGFSSLPAPLIPSIEDDPLFHAALTVDDDMVALAKSQVAYLRQVARTKTVAERSGKVQETYRRVRSIDVAAAKHLADSRLILRAAALHAYAGYGSADKAASTPEVNASDTVLPYRTYVRVTMADAWRHVRDAESARDVTSSDRDAAALRNEKAQAEIRSERAAERAAKTAMDDAKKKLEEDRAVLRLRIAAMPDMAPGMLDRLPDSVELEDGAIAVESPVGTIVVPGTADPRTATALQYIVAQIGKPYVWGGTGPSSYDCSGLMLRGFQAAGVTSMPRVSQGQQVWATPVELKDIQPGDLVFFGNPAYHVGVYIGGGLMIDAPYTGARVRVDRVWSSVTGYGRVVW